MSFAVKCPGHAMRLVLLSFIFSFLTGCITPAERLAKLTDSCDQKSDFVDCGRAGRLAKKQANDTEAKRLLSKGCLNDDGQSCSLLKKEFPSEYAPVVIASYMADCENRQPKACVKGAKFALANREEQSGREMFTKGCTLNEGAACADLANISKSDPAEDTRRPATELAVNLLVEECSSFIDGACDNMEEFSKKCDPTIRACKGLQLYVSRRAHQQLELAETQRKQELQIEDQKKAQMWRALADGLNTFGKSMQSKTTTCNTVGSTIYCNSH